MSIEHSEQLRTASEGFPSQAWGLEYGKDPLSPTEAALRFLRDYSRERPETVAMWAFGIGFILGWKMKPW